MKKMLPHIKAALTAAFLFIGLSGAPYVSASGVAPKQTSKNKTTQVDKKKSTSYSFNAPDFAFPETVEQNADKILDNAVKNRNGLEGVQAAIQVLVARNLISDSSFQSNAEMLDSVAAVMPDPYRSMLLLLEGGMYTQLYNNEPWTYNKRTLPLDSYPEDVEAWSGDLFAKKVLSLVNAATADLRVAESMPLTEIAPVLTNTEGIADSGLSVADFLVAQSVNLLRSFGSVAIEQVIPFRDDAEADVLSPKEELIKTADALIDERIKLAEEKNNNRELVYFISKKGEQLYGKEKLDFLKPWIDRLISTPEGGVVLNDYITSTSSSDYIGTPDSKLRYAQLEEWLKKFPDTKYSQAINYIIESLRMKYVTLSAVTNLLPDTEGTATVAVKNVNDMYVLIYKVPESMVKNDNIAVKDFPGASKCVKTIPLHIDGTVPFADNIEFKIPALPSGYYVMVPSATSKLSPNWKNEIDRWSISLFNVTNLSLFTTSNWVMENSGIGYVVDAQTQQPVAGAIVNFYDNDSRNKLIKSETSDENGAFKLPTGYYTIEAKKDGNAYRMQAGYKYYKSKDMIDDRVNILTDLSIYRPGDEVQFALVAWTSSEGKNELKRKTPLSVVLLDANANDVDTLSLTTDEWGRCDGKFKLPKDGLLGTYLLAAQLNDQPRKRIGYQQIEVAEYKTPSFYVELQKDSTETYVAGDLIKFKGTVKTYSGMPLTGAEVNYSVRWSPWWRFMSRYNSASYGNKVLTDEKGEFVIELPTKNLKGTEFEYGIYSLAATVTSLSGETQSAPDLRFALGSGFSIHPNTDEKTCVTGPEVKFNVPVYDMLDLPVVKDVEYKISKEDDDSKVLTGVFKSPLLTLPAAQLPSGKYNMEFNVVGDTIKTNVQTIIYRHDDIKCPVETPLWLPETNLVAKTGEKNVDVTVGSGYADSYILCIVSDKNGILKREWLAPSDNLIKVKVDAPEGNNPIWVTFSGMHNFNQQVSFVEIVSESSLRKLEVETSVFRDRISAGDKEEWKFTFKVEDDVQKGIPAFAVMSDKALNALYPFAWRFYANGYSRGLSTDISYNYRDRFMTSAHFTPNLNYYGIAGFNPEWNTYSYGLAGSGYGMRIRGTRYMAVAENVSFASASVDYEGVAYYDDVKNEVMEMEPSVSPAMVNSAMRKKELSMDLAEEEAVTADGGNAMAGSTDNIEVRPVEMPLMFFMPRLNTNDKGEVEVKFDVPDFNTTWQFQLMGYNEQLKTASLILDAVASKPVMVRSNPPRFVRTGDKMTTSATLFNNTESIAQIAGRVELFNPETNEILLQKDFTDETVDPSGNRTVNVEYTVPDNLSVIGIRSYALSGKFSDGEQTVIPVLPSSTPVIESTNFYLKTGETDFSVKLPKFKKDANVTLKYCDNPIWECVLALPSISTPDSKNVFSIVRALFANSMALNVVERHPDIKDALVKVFADNDTSLLTSNLQKDTELKAVTLNNTPWVNDARSETERMRSLNSLLDKDGANKSVTSLLGSLKDLQTSEGGWSWCPGMLASDFISRKVILYSGIMKQNGCLPSEAEPMIKRGVKFCDDKAYDNYIKSKKKIHTYDLLSYLYARSFFDFKSSNAGFDGLKKIALKKISEEWKEFSVYNKAIAAILLSRSKGYEKTARIILESLNQYASKDASKGWWFDNLSSGFDGMPKLMTTATALEAYSEIEPGTDAVEGLRQWLVLQKETENWGANSYTVEVISAILGSGVNWTSSNEPATFRIGNDLIPVNTPESLTGMVTVNLNPAQVSGKELTISKMSSGPSWGGIISQYIAPINDVKAEKSANLKIDKKLLVVTDTPAGEVAKEGDIRVGDKVRVTLTVTCDKDMDYVALIDERGAFLEPADQISGYSFNDGLATYRETRDTKTSFFIEFLPKGVNVITYDCYADREGDYSVGIATIQSQYSPLQVAHSSGREVSVK